jgi:hypothetical protein
MYVGIIRTNVAHFSLCPFAQPNIGVSVLHVEKLTIEIFILPSQFPSADGQRDWRFAGGGWPTGGRDSLNPVMISR